MGCGVGESRLILVPDHYYLAMAPVDAGEIRVEFQPTSANSGEVEAKVWIRRDRFVVRPPDCSAHWSASEAPTRRVCDIAVESGAEQGWLEVQVSGPEGTAIGIASPPIDRDPPPVGRPQVFVIVLDTLRKDAFDSVLEFRDESAALRLFVADSIVFENARAPSSWTRPSTASLFTGLHPRRHRVQADHAVLSRAHQTLAELVRA